MIFDGAIVSFWHTAQIMLVNCLNSSYPFGIFDHLLLCSKYFISTKWIRYHSSPKMLPTTDHSATLSAVMAMANTRRSVSKLTNRWVDEGHDISMYSWIVSRDMFGLCCSLCVVWAPCISWRFWYQNPYMTSSTTIFVNLHTGKHSMKVWVFQYSCLEVCWRKTLSTQLGKLRFLCKPETSQLVNPLQKSSQNRLNSCLLLPLSDACDGKAKDFSAGFHKIGAFR